MFLKNISCIFLLLGVILPSSNSFSRETFVWPFNDLPQRVDNLDWRSLDRWFIINQVFETLVRFDGHYALKPTLAKKWKISEDRKRIEFTLKSNIFFSDGTEITSKDVIYSLKRYLLTQDNNNLFKKIIVDGSNISNIDSNIKGLQVINNKKFRLSFKKPFENLWSYLSFPNSGGIIKTGSANKKTFNLEKPIYSGDYMVTKIENKQITLQKNPHSKTNSQSIKTVYLKKVIGVNDQIKKFAKGEADVFSVLDPFMLKKKEFTRIKNKSSDVLSFPLHRLGFIYLNPIKYPNLRTRERISSAFNYKTLSSNYKHQNIVWSNDFFPSGAPGYIGSHFKKTVNIKQKIKNIKEVTILLEKGLSLSFIKEVLTKQFKQLGMKVLFTEKSKREIAKAFVRKDFDISFTTIGFPVADHEYAIYLYFVEKPWYLQTSNKKILKAFERITSEASIEHRSNIMKNVSSFIFEEKYIIPLFHNSIRYFLGNGFKFNKSKGSGVDFHLRSVIRNDK